MTMPLAHPPAEDLGRFIEGTLDDAARTAMVEHIADCDECRVVVADASEFGEESKTATGGLGGWRWMAVAAVVTIVAAGAFYKHNHRDKMEPLTVAYAQQESRPVDGRLSDFQYIARARVNRGFTEQSDAKYLLMQGAAGEVLETSGDDAKTLHDHGVANLLFPENRRQALDQLKTATAKDPKNARYWSDLAAAELALGDASGALESTNRALALDKDLQEALFNRGIALQQIALQHPDRSDEATAAFRTYLAHDSSSLWAKEARTRIEEIQRAQ